MNSLLLFLAIAIATASAQSDEAPTVVTVPGVAYDSERCFSPALAPDALQFLDIDNSNDFTSGNFYSFVLTRDFNVKFKYHTQLFGRPENGSVVAEGELFRVSGRGKGAILRIDLSFGRLRVQFWPEAESELPVLFLYSATLPQKLNGPYDVEIDVTQEEVNLYVDGNLESSRNESFNLNPIYDGAVLVAGNVVDLAGGVVCNIRIENAFRIGSCMSLQPVYNGAVLVAGNVVDLVGGVVCNIGIENALRIEV